MKNLNVMSRLILLGAALASLLVEAVSAQPAPVLSREQPISVELSAPANPEALGAAFTAAAEDAGDAEAPQIGSVRRLVAAQPGTPWVQLSFGDSRLFEGSYLTITSLEDGQVQKLDDAALAVWGGSSALFNGAAVEVELHLAEGDPGSRITIDRLMAGEGGGAEVEDAEALCNADDRIAAVDAAVGRIRPVGCTGWLIANGAILTAGHCTDGGTGTRMKIVEFDVPPSREDGTLRVAAVEDQYPIDTVSIEHGVGVGNDWAVFRALPNSQTGLLPAQQQGVFYRLASGFTPEAVSITGYGVDDDPPGDSIINNFRNAQNQTLQTDAGPWVDRSVQDGGNRVTLRYRADTRGGNSGSPVLDPESGLAVGIHTHNGCGGLPGGNRGTGFENPSLHNAIAAAAGGGVVIFVDPKHPATEEDGSILRPFDTLGEAFATAPKGAVIHVAPGAYPETILAVPESVTLSAPAGPFSIGGR